MLHIQLINPSFGNFLISYYEKGFHSHQGKLYSRNGHGFFKIT